VQEELLRHGAKFHLALQRFYFLWSAIRIIAPWCRIPFGTPETFLSSGAQQGLLRRITELKEETIMFAPPYATRVEAMK
jgi:hypothetical protein